MVADRNRRIPCLIYAISADADAMRLFFFPHSFCPTPVDAAAIADLLSHSCSDEESSHKLPNFAMHTWFLSL